MYLCHLEGLKLIVIHLVLQMVRAHYYKSLQKTETMELFMSYYKHSWVNLSKPIVYSYKETVRKRFYTESLTFQILRNVHHLCIWQAMWTHSLILVNSSCILGLYEVCLETVCNQDIVVEV